MAYIGSVKGDLLLVWRPRRWIGWFGFAQGVDSMNCCSLLTCCAAAEEDRADVAAVDVGWYEFKALWREAAALRIWEEDCVICEQWLAGYHDGKEEDVAYTHLLQVGIQLTFWRRVEVWRRWEADISGNA